MPPRVTDGIQLQFNNAAYSAAAVETGSYTLWGYANVLWRGNTFPTSLQLSGNALAITKQLASQLLKTDAGVSGILISSMKVHRNYDGGPIKSGGTPPPLP
jgi:hypothetical protein